MNEASCLINTAINAHSDEMEILLICARMHLAASQAERLRQLSAQPVDWSVLITLANRHGIFPLLYRHVQAHCPQAVPPEVLNKLSYRAKRTAKQNFILSTELLKVKRLLAVQKIEFITFKGPCLALQAYASLSARVFADLDIVIAPADVPLAQKTLLEAGYTAEPREFNLSLDFMQSALFRRLTFEQSFARREGAREEAPFIIDLHWQMTSSSIMSVEFSTLLAQTTDIELSGQPLRTFKPELALVLLSEHGTRHQWKQIRWIVDIAELIAAHPQFSWTEMFATARSFGIERKVDFALFLCQHALSSAFPNMPPAARARVDSNAVLKRLCALTMSEWTNLEESVETFRSSWLFGICTFDVVWQPFSYILSQWFQPTVPSYLRCPLPQPLFFLYYIIHPTFFIFDFVAARFRQEKK